MVKKTQKSTLLKGGGGADPCTIVHGLPPPAKILHKSPITFLPKRRPNPFLGGSEGGFWGQNRGFCPFLTIFAPKTGFRQGGVSLSPFLPPFYPPFCPPLEGGGRMGGLNPPSGGGVYPPFLGVKPP